MSQMTFAYMIAALAVWRRLQRYRPSDLALLGSIGRGDVAVFSGTFDAVEELLALVGIDATIDPSEREFQRARIAFANCSHRYSPVLTEGAREFVEKGGCLITSDWSLRYVLEHAFPGMLGWSGEKTGEEEISIQPSEKGIWSEVAAGSDPKWSLWGSYPIEVLDHERVTVMASSHDLGSRYGEPTVAAHFEQGAGRVLHMIGHFRAARSLGDASRGGPYTTFLKEGMGLTPEDVAWVIEQAAVDPSLVGAADLEMAVMSVELLVQICIRTLTDGVRHANPAESLLKRIMRSRVRA